MACACIRRYDFDLSYTSCKDLIYVDHSEFQTPGTYTLQVIDENGKSRDYLVTPAIPVRLEIGNCAQGIYTFKVPENCQHEVFKRVAVLCNVKCGWLKAVARLGAEDPLIRSLDDRIAQIDYAVRDDRITVAQHLLETVKRDLRRVNCECTC